MTVKDITIITVVYSIINFIRVQGNACTHRTSIIKKTVSHLIVSAFSYLKFSTTLQHVGHERRND